MNKEKIRDAAYAAVGIVLMLGIIALAIGLVFFAHYTVREAIHHETDIRSLDHHQ